MSMENPETRDDRPANGADAPPGPGAPTDSSAPADLVAAMVAAGEWPAPDLLEKIVEAGDAAVDPLLDVLRTRPRGWPAEAPLDHAMGLLSVLKAPRAVPGLIAVVKEYSDESSESAIEALKAYGPDLFETFMELLHNPQILGYNQFQVLDVLGSFASDDPERRARLSEQARRLLAAAIERGREESRQARERMDRHGDGDDDETIKEEENVAAGEKQGEGAAVDRDENRLEFYEETAFLITKLAYLADPEARELIKTAFAEDLVETWIIQEKEVEELYRHPEDGLSKRDPAEQNAKRDWVGDYREHYRNHLETRGRPRPSPALPSSFLNVSRRGALEMPVEPPPAPEPIRNTNPKIGRNDPCWCGSGKKYKKCHLGKDGPK